MSDEHGPDPTGAPDDPLSGSHGVDPLRQLRLRVTPLAPRPAFTGELRRRIEAALAPPPSPATAAVQAETDQETTMSTSTPDGTTPARTRPVLSPYLAVPRAAEAIDWYRDVLGAVETMRYVGDDGRVGHCELVISGSVIMLADEFPEIGVRGPGSYGGTPVMLHLQVADVDYSYRRAVAAGAEAQRPPADQGHGNRNATIVDPYGHRWMLSQPLPADQAMPTSERDDDSPRDDSSGDATHEDDVATDDDATVVVDSAGAWTVTGRAPVEPGYLTLNPDDPARAQVFFGSLFAWQVEHGDPDGGGHIGNTRFPMGIAPRQHGAAAGHAPTTVYFRVDDPEHYAAAVEELGGRVLARNHYDSGASITCEDDQGYRFELWQPAPGY